MNVGDGRPPFIIFTDGAHEESGTGYGGVMIDPFKSEVAGFGKEDMGKTMKDRLTHFGKKKQIIGQAELYPMIAARRFWKVTGADEIS